VRVALPRAAIMPGENRAPDHFVPDDALKFRLEPNARWTQHGDRDEFSVEYRTGVEGFRRGGDDTPAADAPRILVLGNSFVEGWGVAFESAFINVAGRALSAAGARVELVNYGMSGYSTAQSYLLLQTLVPQKPWGALLLLTPGNLYDDRDFLRSAAFGPDGLATGVDILRMSEPAPRAPDPWYLTLADRLKPHLRGSALFRTVYRGLYNRHQVGRIRPGDPDNDRFFFTRPGVDYEKPLSETLRYVDAMHALCRAQGVRFLAVVMPYGHQVAAYEWADGRRRERLEAGRVYPEAPLLDLATRLESRGIPVLNLLPALQRETRPDRPLFFRLDIHLNEAGNRLVGEELARWLLPLLRQDTATRP